MGVIIPLTNPQYPSYTYLDIRTLYKDNAEDSKMTNENDVTVQTAPKRSAV